MDNTYQLVQWTGEEYDMVGAAFLSSQDVIVLKTGIFRLDHIRAIVHLPKIEEDVPTVEGETEHDVIVTEMGDFDREMYELLTSSGIDLGDIVNEGRVK